jgi:ABC-type dipeptide/oligopeptide/nickel transport system ATPase component
MKNLIENLSQLSTLGVVGMKQSFEDEGVLLDDVITVKRITELCNLQSYVKIGGCEAKTDLYNCVRLGVNGVIAPMVETPFALSKFINIINDYPSKIDPYIVIESKTAYENIAFAMEAAGRTEEEIAADVPHVLNLVDLSNKMWSFPHQLSGGEKQRVAIARAIVNQPDIIIADEPTGNLDPVNTYEIVQILKKINDLGTTVILTTHNKGVIDSLGRRVITMENGKIARDNKEGKYIL